MATQALLVAMRHPSAFVPTPCYYDLRSYPYTALPHDPGPPTHERVYFQPLLMGRVFSINPPGWFLYQMVCLFHKIIPIRNTTCVRT